MYNPELLLDLLGRVLGSAYRLKESEVQFFCPKCNHHKQKLQVNLSNGKSHCWVCNFSAHTAPQLLQKINAPQSLIREVLELVGDYRDYRVEKKKKLNGTYLYLIASIHYGMKLMIFYINTP